MKRRKEKNPLPKVPFGPPHLTLKPSQRNNNTKLKQNKDVGISRTASDPQNQCDFLERDGNHPAAKGVRQNEFGKKSDEKSDRSIRKSDQKVTERVPKTKK